MANPVVSLWPGLSALLVQSGSQIELVRLNGAGAWSFDGVVAQDFTAFAAGGPVTERLRALALLVPDVGALLAQRPQALSRSSALRLGGFDTLFLELLGRCNERCLHCYAGSGPEVQTALSKEVCLSLIDDAQTLGFARVQLTGGDPLLCEFLPKLVARVREREMQPEIYTNGLLFKEALLAELLPNKPALAFSFYSHNAATHDAITCTPNSQARTLRALDLAVQSGLPVRVSVVVLEQNANDVEATVALLNQHGVPDVGVSGSYQVGRGAFFAGDVRRDATHKGGALGPDDLRGSLAVLPDGNVTPCIFNRTQVLGNALTQRLLAIVAAPKSTPVSGVLGKSAMQLVTECSQSLQCTGCRTTRVGLGLLA